MDPDLSRMTLTRTRCLPPDWAVWELFEFIFSSPGGSSRRPDVGGLALEAQLFQQALAGFLVTVVDVAEILLGQIQLGCELGQRLLTLDALHDGEQLFDGRRFVCHTGIHCIPIRDTKSNVSLGLELGSAGSFLPLLPGITAVPQQNFTLLCQARHPELGSTPTPIVPLSASLRQSGWVQGLVRNRFTTPSVKGRI